MRKIRAVFLIILFSLFILIMILQNDKLLLNLVEPYVETESTEVPKLKSNQSSKEIRELIEGDLFELMGKSDDDVRQALGEPIRKDPTPYGYAWWVYTDELNEYTLIGMNDSVVETIYATGTDVPTEPFVIGMTYDELAKQFPIKDKVTYQTGLSFYSFLLNDTDRKTTPLIELADDLFVQCYFDTFTNELSSIRIITGDMLLKQRFYEMEYRGVLPDEEELSNEQWEKIERGMEEQIFELTNIHRNKFDISPLLIDEQVSEVAYLHSKDMYDHHYFSHYGQDGTGLKDRLAVKEVYYLSAGENIAAQHTDAPAAVEGWLNSEGHREALLNDDYTHLGVGVHRLYYTQNFLLKY